MGEAEAALVDEKQVDLGVHPNDESVIWSQEVEVCLFHAMLGHKPVGERAAWHVGHPRARGGGPQRWRIG